MNLFYFTQIFPIVPKFEWNCFNYPHSIEAFGIYPNVSDCIQISMKRLYITQIGIKLFEFTQIWKKLLHLPKFEWSYYCLLQVHLVYLNIIYQNFPIHGNISNSYKLEWSCSNLLKFDWGRWNLSNWF